MKKILLIMLFCLIFNVQVFAKSYEVDDDFSHCPYPSEMSTMINQYFGKSYVTKQYYWYCSTSFSGRDYSSWYCEWKSDNICLFPSSTVFNSDGVDLCYATVLIKNSDGSFSQYSAISGYLYLQGIDNILSTTDINLYLRVDNNQVFNNSDMFSCTFPVAISLDNAKAYLNTHDSFYLTNKHLFDYIPLPYDYQLSYDKDNDYLHLLFKNEYVEDTSIYNTVLDVQYLQKQSDGTYNLIYNYTYEDDYTPGSSNYIIEFDCVEGYDDVLVNIQLRNAIVSGDGFYGDQFIEFDYIYGSDIYSVGESLVFGPFSKIEKPLEEYVSSEEEEEDYGWLNPIINGFKSIGNTIIGLFVPDKSDFSDIKDKWVNLLSSRFGAVYQSFYYVIDFVSRFENKSSVTTIQMPLVEVPLAGEVFAFGGYDVQLIPSGFEVIVEVLKKVISIVCTVGFLNVMKSKLVYLVGGGSHDN